MQWLLLKIIRVYQLFLSPILGSSCRFEPTCSSYSYQAISRHGAIKGFWLSLKRISKCHPWGKEGYDPVPELQQPESKPIESKQTKSKFTNILTIPTIS